MSSTTITIELDGTEFDIEFKYEHFYSAARLFGAPEDCCPEEEEFEWVLVGTPPYLNAIESWELDEIGEEVFFEAAMANIESRKQDYGDYLYDVWKDEQLGV